MDLRLRLELFRAQSNMIVSSFSHLPEESKARLSSKPQIGSRHSFANFSFVELSSPSFIVVTELH